jgi:hypothetical protein
MSVNKTNGVGENEDVVVRKAERGWVVGDENVSDLTSAMVLADLFAADQADDDDTRVMEAVDEHGAPRRAGRGSSAAPSPAGQSPAGQSPAAQSSAGQPQAARAPAPRSNDSGPQKRIPAVSGAPGIEDRSGEAGEAARLAVTVAQLEHALAARVRVEQAIGVLAERHRLRPREAFDLLRKASRSRGTRVTELAQDVVASTANPLLRLPDELSRTLPEARQRGRSLRRGSGGRHAAGS